MEKPKAKTVSIISENSERFWHQRVNRIMHEGVEAEKGTLAGVVKNFYQKKGADAAKLAEKYKTPFYLFDGLELKNSLDSFKAVFSAKLPGSEYYYAVKVNWHPYVLKSAVKNGFGLDVSSGRELGFALKSGAQKIVFSGPGKTEADLREALKNNDKVIVHLDSFQELSKLGQLSDKTKKTINAGVRIYTKTHGIWNKFGIPLQDLKNFWTAAKKYSKLRLVGIQSHLSWNKNAGPYRQVINELSEYLKINFSENELGQMEFIDLGGGFLPEQANAYYPWGTAKGNLIKVASEYLGGVPDFKDRYYITEAVPLAEYAAGISGAIKQFLKPIVQASYFFEPGRIISHNCMHLVMRVIDVKEPDKIIADAGVNMIGWEGLRHDYAPIINLDNFSAKEKNCLVYGNLCMADDIWGYSIFAKKVKTGDTLAVPNQGAYTYSLAQNFIKEIPPVYRLN